MNSPVRIQRKRTKGWKMPENTVYVGRPTKWGNRYRVVYKPLMSSGEDGIEYPYWVVDSDENYIRGYNTEIEATKTAVRLFSHYIYAKIRMKVLDPKELKGKNLACFCRSDKLCHADVLIEVANGQLEEPCFAKCLNQ